MSQNLKINSPYDTAVPLPSIYLKNMYPKPPFSDSSQNWHMDQDNKTLGIPI